MKKEQILPTMLIIIQMCASVPYLCKGNLRLGIYWIAAAVLNIVVTY